ncbi:MAG: sialate O-acetylesterase [Verrucomicrobiota bacterium]
MLKWFAILFFPLSLNASVEWQVWVFIGQSLMGGPSGDSTTYTTYDDDGDILEYTMGEPNNGYQTVQVVKARRERLSPSQVFARRMVQEHNEKNVCIIRCSPGGFSITAFIAEERREVEKKENNVDLWPYWVDLAREKIDFLVRNGDTVNLRGVIMFQGSSDRTAPFAEHYGTHLKRLKEDTRERFGIHDLPWMQIRSPIGGINSGWRRGPVHDAQEAESDSDRYAKWISADSPLGLENYFPDRVHPDPASAERIGVLAADAWVENFDGNHSMSLGRWAIEEGKSSEVGDDSLIKDYISVDFGVDANGFRLGLVPDDPHVTVTVFWSKDLKNWIPISANEDGSYPTMGDVNFYKSIASYSR